MKQRKKEEEKKRRGIKRIRDEKQTIFISFLESTCFTYSSSFLCRPWTYFCMQKNYRSQKPVEVAELEWEQQGEREREEAGGWGTPWQLTVLTTTSSTNA
jgi:hypothetical protein